MSKAKRIEGSANMSRRNLLARLGLAATAAYVAPAVLRLDEARASDNSGGRNSGGRAWGGNSGGRNSGGRASGGNSGGRNSGGRRGSGS